MYIMYKIVHIYDQVSSEDHESGMASEDQGKLAT